MAATLAARNITSQFLKYRMEYKSKKHRFGRSLLGTTHISSGNAVISSPISSRGRQRLLSYQSDEDEGVEMTTTSQQQLPPLWADMVEEAHDDVEQIKEKMSQLQKAQQRRLLKVFEDGEGQANPDLEIDALTANLTHLFKRCEGRVQQICVTQTPDSDTRCDQLLQQNAQRSIAAQLQALNAAFRSQQKTYLAEVKRRTHGEDIFGSSDSASGDTGFADDLTSELALMEQDADLRQGELAKIAQSMTDLHQIFKDLNSLVIDQGTILDRIDYNVEQVLQNTAQANVQLRKAEENQRSGRAAQCIVFLVITIFFLLVLLIMKHT
ncbi:SNARE domain-containing protein [Toxoplasma gondii GAB2-2007-GAL-DOM2]|uniref:SNARE domain-containing protein n=2 Tax=Toxoplasma gondii TaxID=5811 RepID=A0A086LBP3_TOXGO|nr:SNARE domain-containing protein [Toxoplasma gondii GAB2-2007-GAL-DOM2]KFG54061.1 SNARE domain-containing protein [Toxoplasma gondii FOU]